MKPNQSKGFVIAAVAIILVLVIAIAWRSSHKSDNGNSAGVSTENKIEDTPAALEERARVNKLSELTSDNIGTQAESKQDKKTLKDRRLFVNYLIAQKVTTSKKLIDAMGDIENSVKKDGIEFTDSDAYVIIAGYSLENKEWTMCGDFNANKKSLDSRNKYYGMIDSYCNPPTSPKTPTAKK